MVQVWQLKAGKERNKLNDLEAKRTLAKHGFPNHYMYIKNITNITKKHLNNIDWENYDWFSGNSASLNMKKKWSSRKCSKMAPFYFTYILPSIWLNFVLGELE